MQLYQGVIEDIDDPLKMGRVRVRVFGLHTDNKDLIPTKSLPWAQTMVPTTSASMSGIGLSPNGLLRGSWVIVSFLDSDNQYPLIIGSFHGLPVDLINQPAAIEETTFGSVDESNAIVKDSKGQPVSEEATPPKLEDVQLTGARRATDFKSVSQRCIDLLKSYEGFKAKAYLDTNGKWTVGYGTQTVNGKDVVEGQTVTQSEAEKALAEDINNTRLPAVQRYVKVLVTQSMIDALVDFAYNAGNGNLAKSTLLSDLNSEKYLLAATRFGDWTKAGGKELAGLVKRRGAERDLFLADGIPTPTGSLEKLEKTDEAVTQTTTTDSTGNAVTTTTINTNKVSAQRGFTDPTGKYPLYYQEPDTHRLSRHEKIGETIVYKKEAARDTGVEIANGGTWDQSPVPYNAKYPFNKVMASEAGHLMEFDDTENSRRIHIYHAAGTFTEIDDNGTQVNRIVGDGYEILERNGFVHVKGVLHVAVDDAHSLKVGNTLNIEVSGKATINILNDAAINVSGNTELSVAGTTYVKSSGNIALDSDSEIHLNSGMANLPAPGAKQDPTAKSFSELHVITRGAESAMQYETPEEGDSSQYNVNRLESGEATKEELTKTPDVTQSETVEQKSTAPVLTTDCGDLHNKTEFPPTLVLSKYFTIGDLNKNGQRKLIPQLGLQPDEIACNLKMLCVNALDTVKSMYPNMVISSGFRRPGDAANSSKTSQHYTGEAVDIQLPGFSRSDYMEAVKKIKAAIPYDQILLEYEGSTTTWIHISYASKKNRNQIFTMYNHKRISDFGELKLA